MAHDLNLKQKGGGQGIVHQTPTIACDWCCEPCKPEQITRIAGAKFCQGCAANYLGDDDDEGDEDSKE